MDEVKESVQETDFVIMTTYRKVKESGQETDFVIMTTYRISSRKAFRELTWSTWLPTGWGQGKRLGNWLRHHDYLPDEVKEAFRELTWSTWLPTGWGQGKWLGNWLGRHGYLPDEVEESVQGTDSVVSKLHSILILLWPVGFVARVDGQDEDDPEDDGQEGGDKVVQDAAKSHPTTGLQVHRRQT